MVSVIMSAYNASSTILNAINSVLGQTYQDIQLIVINDCSTDNTQSIVSNINDPRILLINNECNMGCGMSRRIGLSKATGEYITFLDSDDFYSKNHLETLISAANTFPDADIIHSGFNIVYNTYIDTKVPRFRIESGNETLHPNEVDTKRLLWQNLIKKELFDKVEYSHRRYIEDTPTLFKLLYLANKVITIEHSGYNWVQREDSLTHTSSMVKNAVYRCLAAKDIIEFLKTENKGFSYNDLYDCLECLKPYLQTTEINNYQEELDELKLFLKGL